MAGTLWLRMRRAAAAGALVIGVVWILGACAADPSTATWEVARGEQLTADTSEFTAIVSRVGCSSGVQGEPQTPEIEFTDSEIQITFTIAPRIDGGTCEGTLGVPVDIDLGEPIGDRSLVDGECHPGSTAWSTAFCLEEGVRYSPK